MPFSRWQYEEENVLAVQVAAGHATVLHLGHAVAGQDGRVGQVELAQLGQAGDGGAGVADDALNRFLAGLRAEVAEGDLRVPDDGRKHLQEGGVPGRGRLLGTTLDRSNHKDDLLIDKLPRCGAAM